MVPLRQLQSLGPNSTPYTTKPVSTPVSTPYTTKPVSTPLSTPYTDRETDIRCLVCSLYCRKTQENVYPVLWHKAFLSVRRTAAYMFRSLKNDVDTDFRITLKKLAALAFILLPTLSLLSIIILYLLYVRLPYFVDYTAKLSRGKLSPTQHE